MASSESFWVFRIGRLIGLTLAWDGLRIRIDRLLAFMEDDSAEAALRLRE
jgi:hypothetical protein